MNTQEEFEDWWDNKKIYPVDYNSLMLAKSHARQAWVEAYPAGKRAGLEKGAWIVSQHADAHGTCEFCASEYCIAIRKEIDNGLE